MMEIGSTLAMRALPSIPLLSVIRRVNDVLTGGTHLGRPVGEISPFSIMIHVFACIFFHFGCGYAALRT